jgi:uncharacterized delta-60 repeat protein
MRHQWPVLVAVLVVGRAFALGPGDLDPDFNGGQLRTFDIAATAPRSTGFGSVLVDGEGRYVVVGSSTDPNGKAAIAVVRVTAQGGVDGSFGSSGAVVLQAGEGSSPYSYSLGSGLSPSGLLVAGAYATKADGRNGAGAVRLLANGTPDPGFGANGVVVVQASPTPPGYGSGAYAGVASDDSVYVTGTLETTPATGANRQLLIVKFDSGGVLVPSFGNGVTPGAYIGSFSQYPLDTATHGGPIVTQPSGKFLVAGLTLLADSRQQVFLARFTSGGAPDATFGTTGAGYTNVKASDPSLVSGDSQANAMTVGPDGYIYVGGRADDSNRRFAMAVTRFGAGGAVDGTFGSMGTRRVQVAEGTDDDRRSDLQSVMVDADGRVLLLGTARDTLDVHRPVLVRLLADGSLDGSFGTGGVLQLQGALGSEAGVGGAALTSDGKLVVVGSIGSNLPVVGFVARILLSTPPTPPPPPPPPPTGCSTAVTFDAILCRIDVLRTTVDARVAAGRVHDRLAALLATARAKTVDASTAAAGRARKKAVKKAVRSFAAAKRVLQSKAGRKLDGALRDELKAAVRGLQDELKRVADSA